MKPVVAALALSGCATIIAGGPDEVPVMTNPPGAYIYLDGKVVGQTPKVITLERDSTLGDIRLYYPGFQPVMIRRYKRLNGWVFMNFFVGMMPVIVDFISGDWQRFDDDSITVALVPGEAPPPYGLQPQSPPPQ